MAQHARLRVETGLEIYFCDPQSPWQRGSNENTNDLLRQYFPKATDLMPEFSYARAAGHNHALDAPLRLELLSAEDVRLSLVLPRDVRVQNLVRAALDDPGNLRSIEAWLPNPPASRKTIERIFIAETGMPPSRWSLHARVLHAVALLAAGQKVTSVAFEMGCESSSAFSYMF